MVPLPIGSQDEDVAFKVLNQDNLPMAIIGEPILKPLDKSKPNLIVHPTRRINKDNLEVTKSNGFLNGFGGDDKVDDVNKFNKTLDLKLKKLQKDELSSRQNKKSPTENVAQKKPFVTTVKKGQFLEPPSEVSAKPEDQLNKPRKCKESKLLYAYASRPRVLSRTPPRSVHQTRCDAAAKAHAKLVGAIIGVKADEKNGGFSLPNEHALEKRVANQNHQQPKWNPHFAYAKMLSKHEVNAENGTSRAEEAKRRSLARKRARNQHLKTSEKALNSCQVIPTETLNIDQLQKVLAKRQLTDISTQTEEIGQTATSLDVSPKSDIETQIYPGDLFDFNKEVQPVIEVLVGRTIEQALIEVLEEEELAALKKQQRRFIEVMSDETAESMKIAKLKRLQNREVEKQLVTAIVAQYDYRPMLIGSV